jgi:Xaa-Pro aminopeptidase
MLNRIQKLRDKIGEQGIIISNPTNALYFSGINSSNITLYISKDQLFLITDFRYKEVAEKNKYGFVVLTQKKIIESLKDIGIAKEVLLETDFLTYDSYGDYTANFENTKFFPANNIILELRIIKEDIEIEYMKMAQEISDKAYSKTLSEIKEGMTELELKALLDYNMSVLGSVKTAFDTIVLFSENSSSPHGVPTNRKLKKGDNVLIDFGATYNNYCSDMTRTFFYGSVCDEYKKAYNAVLEAHTLALNSVLLAGQCEQTDKIARDFLDNSGYKGLFGHSLGHGVGLFIHESPRLSPKSTDVFEENMVFTIEPGIYIEKKIGIRIENTYYLAQNGVFSLTNVEKTLTIL